MTTIDFNSLVDQLELVSWDHSPQLIMTLAEQVVKQDKEICDYVASIEDPTIENTLLPFIDHSQENTFLENQITFYLAVSPVKDIRDASVEAEKLIDKHSIEQSSRIEVYKVFEKLWNKVESQDLDPQTKRYLEKTISYYKRNGLGLPEDKRESFKQYKLRLSELSTEFSKNLNENNDYILFTLDELSGVPEDVIEQFEIVDDNKYKMTYKYPDLFPVLKYAKNQETRKKAYLGNQSKCEPNAAILKEMVDIRYHLAKLLDYNNYSEYILDDRMAKKPENVYAFLDDLKQKLDPLGKTELDSLVAFKNHDLESRGLPKQDILYQWDFGFYHNLLLEKEYQVDTQKIAEYFPLDLTISKMLSFYETLFDIKFHKIENPNSKHLWHEDVKVFAVFQNIKFGTPKPEFMGYIYFDLHPREGKYGHAANFGLGKGFERITKHGRQTPLTVLVCNFTKASKDKPSLLKHHEVVTFFHELGHGVHSILSKTKYGMFHGTAVPRDFVEAPSQMLEFWTWEKNQLNDLSSHYLTKEPISDELINQLVKSKKVNDGLNNLRQLHFGYFDMKLHTILKEEDLNIDLTEIWNKMREDITSLSTENIHTPGYASFGHIAGGYVSGYYGYLYSQVFANDIYYSLFKKDPMNVENGLRYRDTILARGNSKEMMDNLVELLGRQPNSDAFLEELFGN